MKERKRYLSCDFETTVYEGQDHTEVWASACVELGTEDVHIFHSIGEQFDFLASLHSNVIIYYHNLFTNPEDVKKVCEECKAGKRGCVACKKQLAKNIIDELKPIREKRAYYEAHPEIVDKILQEGTKKAQKTAQEVMKRVRKAMMLDYFGE